MLAEIRGSKDENMCCTVYGATRNFSICDFEFDQTCTIQYYNSITALKIHQSQQNVLSESQTSENAAYQRMIGIINKIANVIATTQIFDP